MNGCLGSSTSGKPLNPNVCIYVNDESANPRATNNEVGWIKCRHCLCCRWRIVDMNKTGFDSVNQGWMYPQNGIRTLNARPKPRFYPQKGETYYAKWAKNNYTVTFNNNGHGEQPNAKSVEYGDSVTDLPELSDSANEWVFDGWYMDETSKPNIIIRPSLIIQLLC